MKFFYITVIEQRPKLMSKKREKLQGKFSFFALRISTSILKMSYSTKKSHFETHFIVYGDYGT